MTPEHHLRAVAVTVAAVTAVVIAFVALIYAVSTNRATTIDNGDLVMQVQRSRQASLRDDCEGQNQRNIAALKVIAQQVGEYPPEQRAVARLRAVEESQLVNALAPVRDCQAIVAKRTRLETP